MSITKVLISQYDKHHAGKRVILYATENPPPTQLLKIFSDFPWIAGNNCYLCESMKNNSVILHHHHPIS